MGEFNKKMLCLYMLGLLAAFGAGRFLAPTKVIEKTRSETDTKTDTNTKTSEDTQNKTETKTDKKNDKVYVRIETILPDGTRKIETRIVDKGTITIDNSGESANKKQTDTTTQTETKTETTTEKVVERSTSDLIISGLAGTNITSPGSPAYGASVSKRLLGPIFVGGFGLSNGTCGISLGVGF